MSIFGSLGVRHVVSQTSISIEVCGCVNRIVRNGSQGTHRDVIRQMTERPYKVCEG